MHNGQHRDQQQLLSCSEVVLFNKKYSNGGDCMCEGETTQRRSTAHNGAVVPLCAVAWFLQTAIYHV